MKSIKKDIQLLKKLKKYFKKSIFKIIMIEVLLFIDVSVQTVHPFLWGKIVVFLFNGDRNNFFAYTVAVVFIFLVRMILEFSNGYLRQKLNESINVEIKTDVYDKVLKLPIGKITEFNNGELYNRLESDTSAVAGGMIGIIISVSTNLLKLIIVGTVMIKMNVYMAGIILVGTPIIAIVVLKYGKLIRDLNEKNLKIHDKYYSFVQQIIGGIKEIKAMHISKSIIDRYKNRIGDTYKANMKMALYSGAYSIIGNLFGLIMDIAILLVGGLMILNGTLVYEYFIAFISYEKQFSDAYVSILNTNTSLQTMMTSIERLFGMIENGENQSTFANIKEKNLTGRIKFENVKFSYNGKNEILKGINFNIKPNSITGIIGNNGCGKTTIINLILGLYGSNAGNVTLDGINIKNISEEMLGKNIFPAMQNAFLFNTSIKDNFLLVKPDVTLKEIISACKQSGIHEYIDSLSCKYETLIGEDGAELSGGQRQRLILARSILQNAKILIFDEVTSSIDQESTKNIKEVLNLLSSDHTVIVISHDEFMYDVYDQTIYLDNGEIVKIQAKEKSV